MMTAPQIADYSAVFWGGASVVSIIIKLKLFSRLRGMSAPHKRRFLLPPIGGDISAAHAVSERRRRSRQK